MNCQGIFERESLINLSRRSRNQIGYKEILNKEVKSKTQNPKLKTNPKYKAQNLKQLF